MQIRLARGAGYCFGVKRAMSMAHLAAVGYGRVYSLGPLIHNPREIARLSEQICPVASLDEIEQGVVIIRTHGAGPQTFAEAEKRGLTVIDATCPFVRKAQRLAAESTKEGYQVVIVGDASHPEVSAIVNWTNGSAIVVQNAEEAACLKLPPYAKIGVVAQTTQRKGVLDAVVAQLKNMHCVVRVYDTICHATVLRQDEAISLASRVDAMVVIGGKNSANTQNLAKLCGDVAKAVFLCEGPEDLPPRGFGNAQVIGICAGASTPDWIIEEVVGKMVEMEKNELETVEVVNEAADSAEPSTKEVMNEQIAEMKEALKDAAEATGDVLGTVAGHVKNVMAETLTVLKDSVVELKDNVKENVLDGDDEQTFAEALTEKMQNLYRGARVRGIVAQVRDNEVLVDIGGKSEGVLPSSEMVHSDAENIKENFHVGQEIEVVILKKENKEGYPLLSKRRVDQELLWDKLAEIKESNENITGKVVETVKGGLLVDVGIRGFVPASLVDVTFVEDFAALVGKEMTMKVIECERSRNKLVLSPKAYLQEQAKVRKTEMLSSIAEGQIYNGVVRRLTNFGAFVDIGGVDGLLHVSEMAWYRINQPSDLLKEGDKIQVVVLSADTEKGKISLGMKQLMENPWDIVDEKYPVGKVIPVTIMRTADFGAFAQVEPGMDGLIHISQLSNTRVEKASDVVKPGDVVNVKILSVDKENRRISLSIRETLPKEERVEDAEGAAPRAPRAPRKPAEPREEEFALPQEEMGVTIGDMLKQAEADKKADENTEA